MTSGRFKPSWNGAETEEGAKVGPTSYPFKQVEITPFTIYPFTFGHLYSGYNPTYNWKGPTLW